jgi:VWFA-related protein
MKKFVAVFAPWLLACSAVAQTTPPESGSTIRATSTEVLLDLIVRDKHGKPVRNLKPGEVEIFENGVRQEIKAFRFVSLRDSQEKKHQGSPAVAFRPLRATNVVSVVFHNLNPVARTRALEAVQEFVTGHLQPDTYFGVFNLDDRLTGILPFTMDRTEVLKAAKNSFMAQPVDFGRASESLLTASLNRPAVNVVVNTAAHTASVSMTVRGGEISRSSVAGADVSSGAGANALRGDQVAERTTFNNIAGMRETDRIRTMIDQLGSLPGRKTILLVTTGLLTTGDSDLFQTLVDRATAGGITVYPLDVTGLSETSSSQAANLALGEVAGTSRSQTQSTRAGEAGQGSNLAAMKERSLQNDNVQLAVRASDTQASLRALAEGTGGFLIANTNDFRKSFQRVSDDVMAHYEVAYRPASDKFDGRLRKIDVKLARADVAVESRTGYFAMPDLNGAPARPPFEMMGLAALNTDPLPHDFEFRTSVFQFRKEGSKSASALVIEVPGTSLEPRPRADTGKQSLHASALVLVKDATGQIVDRYGVDSPFEIPEANLAAVRATPITYTHPVVLPPGRFTVETAVLDREAGRSSATVAPLEIRGSKGAVDLSSIVLVQRIEPAGVQVDPADPLNFKGNRSIPFLGSTIPQDAKPLVYFVVYPSKTAADPPKIRVEFLVDGKVAGSQLADLPAPEPSGAVPMIVKAVLHPGNCELKITALQGNDAVTRSVAYTVVAKK